MTGITTRLIEAPDSELKIVNAARVSFAKESTEVDAADIKLMKYLATHRHWTPFSHCRETFSFKCVNDSHLTELMRFFLFELTQEQTASMVFAQHGQKVYVRTSLFGWTNVLNQYVSSAAYRGFVEQFGNVYAYLDEKYPRATGFLVDDSVTTFFNQYGPETGQCDELLTPHFIDVTMCETVPIFVARQRFKHMVGVTYNEVSRRYVDDTPEFYHPDEWRSRPAGSVKQGSGGLHPNSNFLNELYDEDMCARKQLYENMIKDGVAPEQVRMTVPQSMLTSYYVTANVAAWNRFLDQRLDSHAQKEIRDLALLAQTELNK